MPKLDSSHMAAWTSVSIYSHPWLLRSRFCKSGCFLLSTCCVSVSFLLRAGLGSGVMSGGLLTSKRMRLTRGVAFVFRAGVGRGGMGGRLMTSMLLRLTCSVAFVLREGGGALTSMLM